MDSAMTKVQIEVKTRSDGIIEIVVSGSGQVLFVAFSGPTSRKVFEN